VQLNKKKKILKGSLLTSSLCFRAVFFFGNTKNAHGKNFSIYKWKEKIFTQEKNEG
jgi:hypothetical protein